MIEPTFTGEHAKGYYNTQLTGPFDLRIEITKIPCTLKNPPVPVLTVLRDTPSETNITMQLIPGQWFGQFDY